MTRRNSQQKWYENRGKIKSTTPCEGSGQKASEITDEGGWYQTPGSARIKGTLPRGICPVCGDEIALNPLDSEIRKHIDPEAPYKRQLLVSERTYRSIYEFSLKHNLEPDEALELLLKKVFTAIS